MQFPFEFPPELHDLFVPLCADALIIGQLGQSLDGRIATPTGQSKYINGEAGLLHLHRLRAMVDAVVVGINTALMDEPHLNVRFCEGRNPARVIIDPRGRLSPDAFVLRDDSMRCVVITTAASRIQFAPHVERVEVVAINDRIDPHSIINSLRCLGLNKVLIEGGPATLAKFINAGALDRLHIITAPIILGSGKTGLNLLPIINLDEALRPKTKAYNVGDEVIFDCAFNSINLV